MAIVENFYDILERIHSTENSHVGYKKTLAEVRKLIFGFAKGLSSSYMASHPLGDSICPWLHFE